jgi:hypothetical protein
MVSPKRPVIQRNRTDKAIASGKAYIPCDVKEGGVDCKRVAAWRCKNDHCTCAVHGAVTQDGRSCTICDSREMARIQ